MKIAFIGQKGIPTKYGGVEKHTEEIATRLAAKGHKVIVYCRSRYTNVNGYYKGIRIIRLFAVNQKHLETITHAFLSIMHLFLFGEKVDIIHIQSVDPAILTGLAKLKAKVVLTSHGQVYRQVGKWGRFAKTFSKLAERAFIYFSAKRIAVSKTLKDYYESKYHREVVYIPNGVDILTINASEEIKRFNLKKDEYILFVGRLIPTKGCHLLIKTYKSIKTDRKLVIVGGSSYSSQYVEKLKKNAGNNDDIFFLGYQYGGVLQELFANCFLFVFPSEVEGMPVTLLEAMSFAKPIIFSDIPENLEVANGCGLPFKNRNKEDLVMKMLFLLKNPQVGKDLGKKAKERVIRDYDWDRIAEQTEAVYKSLLS